MIPPNTDLSIVSGVLHLLSPLETPGLRLPIDFFLRSLADDLGRYLAGAPVLAVRGSWTYTVRRRARQQRVLRGQHRHLVGLQQHLAAGAGRCFGALHQPQVGPLLGEVGLERG